jgi:hypothetical protein
LSDPAQLRILDALSDGRARYVASVRIALDCDVVLLERMAAAGLLRFPDVAKGGKTVCITPRGLEVFKRDQRKK